MSKINPIRTYKWSLGVVFIFLILFSCNYETYSQFTFRSTPVSFNIPALKDSIADITLPFINIDSLLEADTTQEALSRYGFPIDLDIDFIRSATCMELNDGGRICRLGIISESALALNLICDSFFLPQGANLYMYNEDTSMVLGAYTDLNNNDARKFPSGLLKGNKMIIDYYEPSNVKGSGILHFSRIIHVHEDVFNPVTNRAILEFFCYNDAICEPIWCDQRRSVVIIYNDQGARGSGALITNGRRDLTPYILTAQHLLDNDESGTLSQTEKNQVQNWVYCFNSQREICATGGGYGNVYYPMNGATFKAGSQKSDFTLVELNNKPPGAYNTYYSGWSKKNQRPKSGAVFHHPRGRSKKIGLYDEKLKKKTLPENQFYLPLSKTKVWKMQKFDDGSAVEPVSSGGPIYNQDKLIVGQVAGGPKPSNIFHSYCDEADELTYSFGRFRVSMSHGAIDFLDPDHNLFQGIILAMSGDEPDCDVNLNYTNVPNFPSGLYEASNEITASTNVTVQSGSTVEFSAGNRIVLKPGFTAKQGSNFHAYIEGCITGCGTGVGKIERDDSPFIIYEDDFGKETIINSSSHFSIHPNPTSGEFQLTVGNGQEAKVYIYDIFGRLIEQLTMGNEQLTIDISAHPKGIYLVKVIQGEEIYIKKLIHQ